MNTDTFLSDSFNFVSTAIQMISMENTYAYIRLEYFFFIFAKN